MKLAEPFIQLPLQFDAAAMAAEIAALGESVWRPHPQAFPGNSMLPLIAVNGDAADEAFAGRMLPTPELKRCPYIIHALNVLGVTLGRTRLMRLAGQAEVTPHVDQGYYWTERVRVHIPIVTQPTVVFECGNAAINMAAGECWIFDTWRQHRVLNDAQQSRIHLVSDTVGGRVFWDLVDRGRGHSVAAKNPGWRTQPVAVQTGYADDLVLENVNVPIIMSPWEVKANFGLLFSDSMQHPRLGELYEKSRRFSQEWQALWARYGESEAGFGDYRDALERFIEAAGELGREVQLKNGIAWFSAMMTLIAKSAVSEEPPVSTLTDQHGLSDRA